MSQQKEFLESLPSAWVDKIFKKLTLTYGRDFLARWEGVEISAVKADWGYELRGYSKFPEAIAYALENLPEGKPPTVVEFRAMCFKRPDTSMPALPAPDSVGLKRIAEIVAPAIGYGMETPRAFMERLKREVIAGTASATRKRFYADVVATGYYGNEVSETPAGGHFTAPPAEALPPGMRA